MITGNNNDDISAGFNNFSGHDTPPQHTDGAAIDRNVKPARVESGSGAAHSSDAGDRFESISRHII